MSNLNHNLEIMRQIVESQRIFSAIYQAPDKNPPSSLLVTSASPYEGKTTLAAGLGLLAAENFDKNILIIDLNWYNPALHSCFNLELNHSFKDMADNHELNYYIRETEQKNLKIVSSPTRPAPQDSAHKEILAAGRNMIQKAFQEFDYVILDSASVYPINRYMLDPVSLASIVDSTLMVVMANMANRSTVKKAKTTLENSQTNLVGLVVNHQFNPLK